MSSHLRRFLPLAGLLVLVVPLLALAATTRPTAGAPLDTAATWTMSGQNLANTRSQAAETMLGTTTVSTLIPKWVVTTSGNVSATPAISGSAVIVPGWAGTLAQLDSTTGAVVWSHPISDYNGITGASSRTSPALDGGRVFIGSGQGADLIAADATTGARLWSTQLDPHPSAAITQAPVVANGVVYVGVSSGEEAAAAHPGYVCCTFRGSIAALDATTGQIRWQTYTVPPNSGQPGGYSGAAVWSSSPVVDSVRNSLYITTGDNYSVPASVRTCLNGGGTVCTAATDYFDSVLALDLTTGIVKWAAKTLAADTFNLACLSGSVANCPPPQGPDYDFGAGANLFQATINGQVQSVLGAGQKSGVYWALNPDTGQVLWSTQVGPGGGTGGVEWGTATDGIRIYVAIANSGHHPYTLVPSGKTVSGGAWSALDAATGHILWQTADPLNAMDTAAVTVANGVLYGGSMDPAGHMYALDAGTGAIRWTYASGGSIAAGPAIANGVVYWGSGYNRFGGTSSNKFYAFAPGAGTLALSPTSGAFQHAVTLVGTHFGPTETVRLSSDSVSSTPLYSALTDATGTFTITRSFAAGTYGAHTMFGVGQTSGIAAATAYALQPVLKLTPSHGASGSTVVSSGFDFGAQEAVKLSWDTVTQPLVTAKSHGVGSFTGSTAVQFTVPSGASIGRHTIIAVGQQTGAQAMIPFTVP